MLYLLLGFAGESSWSRRESPPSENNEQGAFFYSRFAASSVKSVGEWLVGGPLATLGFLVEWSTFK